MKGGKLFADTASGMVEVVSVSASEVARLPYDVAEGLYVVGTGSTGAAAGLGICGEGRNMKQEVVCQLSDGCATT